MQNIMMHIRQYDRFHDAKEYAKVNARNMQINMWKNHNKQMMLYAKYAG